jgi:hypothetical protein
MIKKRPETRPAASAALREERLKSALKANLARRKAQAQARGTAQDGADKQNKNED